MDDRGRFLLEWRKCKDILIVFFAPPALKQRRAVGKLELVFLRYQYLFFRRKKKGERESQRERAAKRGP